MSHGDERREFQRLVLDPALEGTFGETPVRITEIGVLGARVSHTVDFSDDENEDLCFLHEGHSVVLHCEIVRTTEATTKGFSSGLRFVSASGDSGDRLRSMLAALVSEHMSGRQQIPVGLFEEPIDGDKTVRGVDAGFLCYRLEAGIWARRRVFLPEQPDVGFTVARSSDRDEMQQLCRVYQASDAEGRRLIRLFAELSVSYALEIPPNQDDSSPIPGV